MYAVTQPTQAAQRAVSHPPADEGGDTVRRAQPADQHWIATAEGRTTISRNHPGASAANTTGHGEV